MGSMMISATLIELVTTFLIQRYIINLLQLLEAMMISKINTFIKVKNKWDRKDA